jgi:hypothetical protein
VWITAFGLQGTVVGSIIADGMSAFIVDIRADPSPGNCAIAGMLLTGAAGVIVGLVVGLNVHAATAWAAMFELGIPSAVAGAAGYNRMLWTALRRKAAYLPG